MILPAGSTGVSRGGQPAVPGASFRVFGTLCHAVARRGSGRVVEMWSCERRVTPNFHLAELALRSGTVYLLCNAFCLWLGASDRRPEWMGGPFVTSAEVEAVAAEWPDFHFLSPEELEAPLAVESVRGLLPVELGQLLYWRPERLGDVIFNFWD